MVRKSYYVFVFIFGLIKMDPAFSSNESSFIDSSEEEGGKYTGFSGLVLSPTAVREENIEKPTALKKPPKKRAASCFFLRKRKARSDGK